MIKEKLNKTHTQHLDQSNCGVVCLQTILKIMKELSVNKLENLETGKFWGKDCHWVTSSGGCTQVKYCDHYALWIKYDSTLEGMRQTGLC